MTPPLRANGAPAWSAGRGTWRHPVASPYQAGTHPLAVLVPERLDRASRCRVLFLLPVEAGATRVFGDAMGVARELDLANRHGLIVVAPTFDVPPWYGNHATDPHQRQEDYLLKTVVPLIDRAYPTLAGAEGRLLLGFSKSGWGAITLLLRHPDVFGRAASWDAPLMLSEMQFGIWQTAETFGTAENMARNLPSTLLRTHAGPFRQTVRLVLAGSRDFGEHTTAAHELMVHLGIQHRYEPGLAAPHSWNAEWMRPVLGALLSVP